jgi:hypothetical protein
VIDSSEAVESDVSTSSDDTTFAGLYLYPVQSFERRHVAGAEPNAFLKAREKAASES